jgi:hypothetical protein
VGANAFPYINTSSFRIPDATLGVQGPVDVELPNTCCIADDGRHDGWGSIEKGEGTSEGRAR